ncbi:hypothetical protein C0993_006655 [Termitomyces sp. T159_Od127]|nr:hypothetical protein C0993_006655 [Termitomyces sp. T159_Od127]
MSTSTSSFNASLVATAFITHANMLMVHIQGLGVEVPHNKVEVGGFTGWQGANDGKSGTKELEALAWEGMGLKEATGIDKGLGQRQESEEGAKEKTLKDLACTALGAAVPAMPKAPAGGTKGLASPVKKLLSLTKPASKCKECKAKAPRYQHWAPTQSEFFNKELASLLVPGNLEAVVNTGVKAGVVLKEMKGKATVDLAMHQAFKEEQRAKGSK